MRKSINTLSILVAQEMGEDPSTGDLFAFCNRSKSIIKILYWHRNGFCLWQKKLEGGRFKWPCSDRELQKIDQASLAWLLEGLDIGQAHQRLESPVVI